MTSCNVLLAARLEQEDARRVYLALAWIAAVERRAVCVRPWPERG